MHFKFNATNDPFFDEGDDLLPDRLLSGFELEALVRTLKRQQESAIKVVNNAPDAARLYHVSERWAVNHLRMDASIKVFDDAFTLDLALRDPKVKIILIPNGHSIDGEQLQRMCARAPKTKTIFVDVTK